ncbi:MAG TPA: SGNH/GDSL hydrolase family protein [Pseudonocardiaceae bacterium]|jgi:lysophospholipase L1-like esterase
MLWNRTVRVTAVAAGAIGGVSSAMYGLLTRQSRYAHELIGEAEGPPPAADGRYTPTGWTGRDDTDALRFAVVGDSLAAGLGAETAEGLPGVQLAKGLADELGQPVDLATYAISGSTTRDMVDQIDEVVQDPPDVVLIVVGGNDVTTKMSIGTSAKLLGTEVARLRAIGAGVVVGTCPDMLPIQPIHIPLRWIASGWSRLLARAQDRAVRNAGGLAVSLGELVSPEFLARPDELFSADHFHPNGAGYSIAKSALLRPLLRAAGGDVPEEVAPVTVAPVSAAETLAEAVADQVVRPMGRAEPAAS